MTVTYATANDSATTPDDYLAAPAASTLPIPAGQRTGEITVGVVGDDLDENEEKFRVTLSGAVNGTLKDGIGVATIPNDDPVPRLTVADAVVAEGTGGTRVVTLTATLSAASGRPILAGYATRERKDVPAVSRATPDSDFQSATELVTFNAGERTKTISIPIAPDSVIEEDESFQVFVFNAASGADGVTPVTVTIVDDDLNEGNRPRLSVNDVTVREGDAGTTVARFTIAMDRPLPRRVAVSYATANGTAVAPAEYTAVAGRLDFGPGETRKVVEVPVTGDRKLEYGQDYRLRLADAVNAGIADGSGLGTITDDDVGGGTLSVGGRSVKAIDILCRRAPKAPERAKGKRAATAPGCVGIPISWDLASPGAVRVRVTALFRRPKAVKGKKASATPKPIELLRQQLPVTRTGKSTSRARRAEGKSTSALLARIRSAKPARVRVEVRFENRFGGQEAPVVKELRLRL